MDGNPWQVDSLQDFLYLKCPECTYDTQEDLSFQDHALQNHPLSSVFFDKSFVKEEDYSYDYKDPLTTSSGNLSLVASFPKLSNVKEELIDDTSESKEAIEKYSKPKRLKPHICSKCDRGFITPKKLQKHSEIVHEGKKPKTKKKIKQEINEGDELNKKVGKNERPKPHKERVKKQCPKCDKKLSSLNLKSHIKRVHERIFPFLCNTCGYKATGNAELKNHVAVVHEGKRHICPICGVGVTSPTYLKKHIAAVHEGIKSYMCELCSFRCSDQSGLKLHIRNVHDKIKPHKCNICQKSFGYTAELNQHITAVHEGIKAFKCSLCDKKFSFKNGLNTHNKSVHEGKKPHMCAQCGASFSQATTLRRHIKGVHEKETPYVCKICNHGFKQNGNLKYHMDTVHREKENI